MAHLIEYRKVNDTYFPLYFMFATIEPKHNLTCDKYISLENWMYIFDQLDEILSGEASTSKKSKAFEHDRVSVKAKWIKTSDLTGMGHQISKILNSRSTPTNVAKYFLKIEVKLNSDFDKIVKELEKEIKILKEKNKITEPNHGDNYSVKHENSLMLNDVKSEVKSDLLVPKKEKRNSSSLSKNTSGFDGYEDLNGDFEEYIPPYPTLSTTSSYPTESIPTYNPEKSSAQIEMNQIQSEYSPTFLNAVVPENAVSYRPSTRSNRPLENDDVKKSAKRNRLRGRSKDLFGTSDDDDDGDIVNKVSSSSHHKSKRKKEAPLKQETKSDRGTPKSKKKKSSDSQRSQDSVTELGDISLRNLMTEPIDDILDTYTDHEEHLTELYEKHIKLLKRNYRPKDIPELVAHDLVTPSQFQAMVDFLEKKLVRNLEKEHNSSDVIFDAILPEWAFRIFCRKFQYTRSEALETLHQQTIAMSNRSDSQLL